MGAIELFTFAVIGIGTGILAGLVGVSGGLILIPCLVFMFKLNGMPSVYLMQLAIGTSLAAMVFTSYSSMRSHDKKGGVDWKVVKLMGVGLVIGCIAGAFLGHLLPTVVLQFFFGMFAVALGIYLFNRKRVLEERSQLPKPHILNGFALGVGILSNILGIGGGSLTVPIFLGFRMPMKKAVATSAATGFIVSVVGAISYLLLGLGQSFYPYTIGYIYLPAFVILSVTTFVAAPYGAKWAYEVETKKLLRYFAVSLFVIGLVMMVK